MNEIVKPINRGKIRQLLGKEYFILKRQLKWIFGNQKWAKVSSENAYRHSIFKHQSLILRPLKDVDMYLQENKRTNLKIALSKINGTILHTGETFSLWKQIGKPSKRKGYLEGLVLNQGKIDKGIGGGLCQLGNLLFWIAAHSPLDIVERYRHGYDVFPDVNRKIPFGAGATLAYNYIDLQIKNNTSNHFQLQLWMDSEYLNGELFSKKPISETYEIEERNHQIKQQFWGGYSRHNQIVKLKKEKDGTTSESLLVENHAIMMYNPFLEEKNNNNEKKCNHFI